jgi:hypothetical protein
MDYCTDPNAGTMHSILSVSECDNLFTYSTSNWDAPITPDTIGSYTIVFNSNNFYVGKGNKERCRTSAQERCLAAPGGMDNGKWGDYEPSYKTGLRPSSVTPSDQGFKEEHIRIYALGGVNTFAPNPPPNSSGPYSYNKNNSPGLTKINNSPLGY